MQMRFMRIAAMLTVLAIIFTANAALAVSPSDYDMAAPEKLVAEHLHCESALLVDALSGEILFTNNSRVRMYPASTTKIATLYVGIMSGIDPDEVVTVPDEAADIESGSSVIPVKPGDELRWRDLLYSFMMTSGNDGANAIAVITCGSIPAFVEKMNDWVAQIGCVGTHFTNAHGLHDEDHYTTAQDLALMTRVAMEDELFSDIVACAHYDMAIRRKGEIIKRTVETRNTLLIEDQKYYYADCIGVKTGHTGKAGYCFVGAAERDGMRVISVVLNCPEDQHKWYDSAKLFEYGFTKYEDMSFEILYSGLTDEITTVNVKGAAETDPYGGVLDMDIVEVSDPGFTVKAVSGSESSRNSVLEKFASSVSVRLNEDIAAPVSAGETLGTIAYVREDGSEVTALLTASRSVEKQPDPTPTPEPTREPLINIGGSGGRLGGIVSTIIVFFAIILVIGIILSLIAAARRKKRRRMMERRRREQLRRQAQMRRSDSNTRPANGARRPGGNAARNSDRYRRY